MVFEAGVDEVYCRTNAKPVMYCKRVVLQVMCSTQIRYEGGERSYPRFLFTYWRGRKPTKDLVVSEVYWR